VREGAGVPSFYPGVFASLSIATLADTSVQTLLLHLIPGLWLKYVIDVDALFLQIMNY